jgi:S-adenosyl methyltransferase
VTDENPSGELASLTQIDTSVSHSARIWDYRLGGKDNCPIGRQVGDRKFLGRAVRFLATAARVHGRHWVERRVRDHRGA